jgi:hydrogenase/urease accessory protein HupE
VKGWPFFSTALCFVVVCCPATVFAHEVRPAYLELRQISTDSYDVLWKVPGAGEDRRLALYVEMPSDCRITREPVTSFADNAFTERWSVQRDGGLFGSSIGISGLTSTLTDVLARVERLDGTTQVVRLTPESPAFTVESAPDRMQVARTYMQLGFEHILTGVDHLLFVLGLILFVRGTGRLLKTISAFTVAHSVTLTLATLGFVHVPPPPVEVVIALSIVFVAREILMRREGNPTLAERQPWLVAFTFGLLHGLGFAGGLSAAGLPAGHIPLALLLFSLGVEIGHFSFIAAVLTVITFFRRLKFNLPVWVRTIPPYAIGTLAMFWVIQRLTLF